MRLVGVEGDRLDVGVVHEAGQSGAAEHVSRVDAAVGRLSSVHRLRLGAQTRRALRHGSASPTRGSTHLAGLSPGARSRDVPLAPTKVFEGISSGDQWPTFRNLILYIYLLVNLTFTRQLFYFVSISAYIIRLVMLELYTF